VSLFYQYVPLYLIYILNTYCISGVMVSVFEASVVDRAFGARSGQTKDKKKVFVASPLSTHH